MSRKESGLRRMVGGSAAIIIGLAGLPAAAQSSGSRPPPEAYANNNFDGRDEVKITGTVDGVETIGADTIVWVVAKKAEKQGFGVRPGTEAVGKDMLWRVEGKGLAKIKDDPKLAAGAKITATGDNWDDKTCKPSCRLLADKASLK